MSFPSSNPTFTPPYPLVNTTSTSSNSSNRSPWICVARPNDTDETNSSTTGDNPLSFALRIATSLFRPPPSTDLNSQLEFSPSYHHIPYSHQEEDEEEPDDDGIESRLAARRAQKNSTPTPKRRRSTPFPFLRRRPSFPDKSSDQPLSSRFFVGLPEHRVYQILLEVRPPPHTELTTLLPYDLQRIVFDELRSLSITTTITKDDTINKTDSNPKSESDHPNQQSSQTKDPSLLSFPVRVVADLIRGVTSSRDEKREGKNGTATAAVSAAAMAHEPGVGPEVDLDGNSAAAAFAAASAIAVSASLTTLDAAELAGLRAIISAACAISTETDAIEFTDSIGVAPLVTAARLLPLAEKASTLTALANLANMVPKSRSAMLKTDDGSIVKTLVAVVMQARATPVSQAIGINAAIWQTEALVSSTRLLGSLALTRGVIGHEWRTKMAMEKELINGLQRLAGGLKNGQPEGAARAARRALGALGVNTWKPKVPGQRGLRILCIDGGGTRAIMAFETLKQIKKSTGCEIHELFDIIGGTSTGAIVAASIGIAHKTVEDVELLYRDMIGKIFAKHPVNGPKMLLTRSYYDTSVLESTLKRECGRGVFIDSLAEENMNRVFVVSSIMSRDPKQLHVFRNYTYPLGHESRYEGTVEAQLWEGLRASSAAPTFFSEIRINGELHADGAIVANNPTAVALHETKCMYPGVPIELLVSLGNGVSPDSSGPPSEEEVEQKNMGWGDVVGSILASATSTEVVHHAIQDLFPADKYFRFNPITRSTQIDETKPETLASFVKEAQEYIKNNKEDFEKVAKILRPKTPRSLWGRFCDAMQKEMQELEISSGNEDLYLPK